MAYRVDVRCGVHPLVDAEFEHNRITAIAGLGLSRYAAVRDAYEMSFDKFKQGAADSKGALRDMFEAVEILFKLLIGSGSLDEGNVKRTMQSLTDRLYADESHARATAIRLGLGFADWVNVVHPFRHGQETEIPLTLPDDLLVLMLSQGSAYIRWMVDLDKRVPR